MRVALGLRPASLLALLAFALAVAGASGAPAPAKEEVLQVSDSSGRFIVTVPVSGLTMSLPKGGLIEGRNARGGAAAHPRYFFFQEKGEDFGIIVSGWFEPQEQFVSARKVWDDDTRQWSRQGLPTPADVSFQKIGGWEAVVYDLPVPGGSNTHIRAHWVQAGTWIDIHLSLTSRRPLAECREQMLALLNSISVTAKKRPPQ